MYNLALSLKDDCFLIMLAILRNLQPSPQKEDSYSDDYECVVSVLVIFWTAKWKARCLNSKEVSMETIEPATEGAGGTECVSGVLVSVLGIRSLFSFRPSGCASLW